MKNILALAFALILSLSCLAENSTIKFALTDNLGALGFVALKENLFNLANTAKVEQVRLQTGKMSMDSLLSGETDLATIVDSNVAYIGFSENNLKVLSTIGIKLDDSLYFKADSGIKSPKDLLGKKIGYVPATTSHVFLAKFLEFHKIAWEDIKAVSLQPAAMQAALRNKHVDAVSIWQPWGQNIRTEFTDIGEFKNSKEIYPSRIFLASTNEKLSNNKDLFRGIINTLRKSKDLETSNSDKFFKILSEEIKLSESDLNKIYNDNYTFIMDEDSEALQHVTDIAKWIKNSQSSFNSLPINDYSKQFDFSLN